MLLKELKDFYGSSYRFNIETGMSHNCFPNWEAKGYVPLLSQLKLEKITNGRFKASLEHTLE